MAESRDAGKRAQLETYTPHSHPWWRCLRITGKDFVIVAAGQDRAAIIFLRFDARLPSY
jgi:hypothetical protein